MPLPEPSDGESQQDFMSRCIATEIVAKEFPNQQQRIAVCANQFRSAKAKARKASDDIALLLAELDKSGKL